MVNFSLKTRSGTLKYTSVKEGMCSVYYGKEMNYKKKQKQKHHHWFVCRIWLEVDTLGLRQPEG